MKQNTEQIKKKGWALCEVKPALGDIVDLSLDGHEQGFTRIGAVVGFELLSRDLTELDWRPQRRHLLLLGVAGAGPLRLPPKETQNDVVSGQN